MPPTTTSHRIKSLLALRKVRYPVAAQKLSPHQRTQGQKCYGAYSFFNAISYALLAEGFVTLLLLRLGGSEALVGASVGMLYASLPFMWLGYMLIPHLGVKGVAATCWAVRSFSAILFVLAPWIHGWFGGSAGAWMVFLGVVCFTTARATGIISFTGIISDLTTVQDRGRLISRSFLQNQVGGAVVTLLIALLLGASAPLSRYQLLMSVGMVTGLVAAFYLWRIPESGLFRRTMPLYFMRELHWLLNQRGRRWFLIAMLGVSITQGTWRIFLLVVAKQGYQLPDQQMVLLTLLTLFGGVSASLTYAAFLDLLGSRPLLILTGVLDLALAGVVVALPVQLNIFLLCGVFFLSGYIFIALNASIQHYFIALTPPKRQLRLGVLAQGISGLFGGLALFIGGQTLQYLRHISQSSTGEALTQGLGVDPLLHFRWFFAGLMVVFAFWLMALMRIPRLNSQSVRDALNVLFSPWDWRAVYAVRQAVRQNNEEHDKRALEAIGKSNTTVYQHALKRSLRSPSFFVRREALMNLLSTAPQAMLVPQLLQDVQENAHTTAHFSAYVLGQWQIKEAALPLEKAIASPDIELAAEAIGALIKMQKTVAFPAIQACFKTTENPRLIIEGARALSLWGDVACLPSLLKKFHLPIPPQTKAEVSLSVARLLGVGTQFYQDMSLFSQDKYTLLEQWQYRWKDEDRWGLIPAMQAGRGQREMLLQALHDQKSKFDPWFYRNMAAFLPKRPKYPWQEVVFMLTFLWLVKTGLHLDSATL